jgi:hypothetical protein
MSAGAISGVLADSPPEGAAVVAVATGAAFGTAVAGAGTAVATVATGVAVAEDPQATAKIKTMTTVIRIADFFRAMNDKFIVDKPPNG